MIVRLTALKKGLKLRYTDDELEARLLKELDPSVSRLLRKVGTEDHGEILWATFSDDEGRTRIVFRVYRRDGLKAFGLVGIDDLRAGLRNARLNGLDKVHWGIDDEGDFEA